MIDSKVGKYYLVDIKEAWDDYKGSNLQVGKLIYNPSGEKGSKGFEFINNIGCNIHRCNERGKLGHCLYVYPDSVLRELSEEEVFVRLI